MSITAELIKGIMELTHDERKELLAMWKESRANKSKSAK